MSRSDQTVENAMEWTLDSCGTIKSIGAGALKRVYLSMAWVAQHHNGSIWNGHTCFESEI